MRQSCVSGLRVPRICVDFVLSTSERFSYAAISCGQRSFASHMRQFRAASRALSRTCADFAQQRTHRFSYANISCRELIAVSQLRQSRASNPVMLRACPPLASSHTCQVQPGSSRVTFMCVISCSHPLIDLALQRVHAASHARRFCAISSRALRTCVDVARPALQHCMSAICLARRNRVNLALTARVSTLVKALQLVADACQLLLFSQLRRQRVAQQVLFV